jgi:hypothetical protein
MVRPPGGSDAPPSGIGRKARFHGPLWVGFVRAFRLRADECRPQRAISRHLCGVSDAAGKAACQPKNPGTRTNAPSVTPKIRQHGRLGAMFEIPNPDTLFTAPRRPGWWNADTASLNLAAPRGRAGSSPAPGTLCRSASRPRTAHPHHARSPVLRVRGSPGAGRRRDRGRGLPLAQPGVHRGRHQGRRQRLAEPGVICPAGCPEQPPVAFSFV